MNTLAGLRVISSPFAVSTRHEVKAHPIKKRRRNWQVVKIVRPACWQMGDAFFMHPELVAKLKEQA